mmetsp:Transcript_29214/g.49779  ORF Transcript_29214/g.49779 Transcript_29214/m.49779 type:complete len:131 (+) Transcript_29214:483-875(+)
MATTYFAASLADGSISSIEKCCEHYQSSIGRCCHQYWNCWQRLHVCYVELFSRLLFSTHISYLAFTQRWHTDTLFTKNVISSNDYPLVVTQKTFAASQKAVWNIELSNILHTLHLHSTTHLMKNDLSSKD